MTTSTLMWGVLFGSVGFGYFLYGRKQRAVVPLLCGLALMILPYVLTDATYLVIGGAAIAALPYFVRR